MPSLMTYNTLISGCVRAEAPIEALSVFNLMKEKRIKRDQVTSLLCRGEEYTCFRCYLTASLPCFMRCRWPDHNTVAYARRVDKQESYPLAFFPQIAKSCHQVMSVAKSLPRSFWVLPPQ